MSPSSVSARTTLPGPSILPLHALSTRWSPPFSSSASRRSPGSRAACTRRPDTAPVPCRRNMRRDVAAELPVTVTPLDSSAVRGAQAPRLVDPGAAARHPRSTIPTRPRAPVRRRSLIALVPAVLNPLIYIPQHIVQTETVRLESPHRRRLHIPVITRGYPRPVVLPLRRLVRSVRIPTLPPLSLSPVPRTPRPPSRHVLPLRLAQQPISLPRLPTQPFHVLDYHSS